MALIVLPEVTFTRDARFLSLRLKRVDRLYGLFQRLHCHMARTELIRACTTDTDRDIANISLVRSAASGPVHSLVV